jgi:hypothetical protein
VLVVPRRSSAVVGIVIGVGRKDRVARCRIWLAEQFFSEVSVVELHPLGGGPTRYVWWSRDPRWGRLALAGVVVGALLGAIARGLA